MTGPKLNERPGTKAHLKGVRGSASKARRVLNLIRNRSVDQARAILAFSDVGMSDTISKLLESAVANAEHNDGLVASELYISACFADEGMTMKRFRPRARGSASAIHKQTSHITLILSRYSDEELAELEQRSTTRRASRAQQSEARRQRVAKSLPVVTDDSGETESGETSAVATNEEEE